mgnify:CR=1 FL=1
MGAGCGLSAGSVAWAWGTRAGFGVCILAVVVLMCVLAFVCTVCLSSLSVVACVLSWVEI